MTNHDDDVVLPVVWVGLDEEQIVWANQFTSTFLGPGEFVVNIGQVSPPLVLGDPQEQQEQLRHVSFVAIQPVARLMLSENGMRQLVQILTENLQRYDQAFKQRRGGAEA